MSHTIATRCHTVVVNWVIQHLKNSEYDLIKSIHSHTGRVVFSILLQSSDDPVTQMQASVSVVHGLPAWRYDYGYCRRKLFEQTLAI